MSTNTQTQTECRDNESQTSSFHLIVPEPWQMVQPDPWVLAGCPAIQSTPRDRSLKSQACTTDLMFSRPKTKKPYITTPFVYPTRDKDPKKKTVDRLFLEEHSAILEPFLSSSFKGLEELEQCHSFRAAAVPVVSSPPSVMRETTSTVSNVHTTLPRGSRKAPEIGGSGTEQVPTNACHRNYVAHLGKQRKMLTPRCDPSLLGRMERENAVVLLQRCLRGRAAQVKMTETRSKVLHLYPELNELDGHPGVSTTKDAHSGEGMAAMKAFVGNQLYSTFLSLRAT